MAKLFLILLIQLSILSKITKRTNFISNDCTSIKDKNLQLTCQAINAKSTNKCEAIDSTYMK